MTSHLSSSHQPPQRPVGLPLAGPQWFASVMGTGILSTLLGRRAGDLSFLVVPAATLLVVAGGLLIGLTVAFGGRVAQDRQVFARTVRDATVVPTWGTVAMGVLSVGSASVTVLPLLGAQGPSGDAATWVVALDAGAWTIGTAIGLFTVFGFAAVLVKSDVGHPVPAWGLALVPPMVSATTGAALVPHLSSTTGRLLLLVGTVACFFLSLFLGGLVFAVSYHHHWRVSALPAAAATSTWIPLGVVGQSMAAAQVMAAQSRQFLTPSGAAAVSGLADAYGWAMLVLAVPVVTTAVVVTVRGLRAGMPFTPGWWAMTFPVGTLALGSSLLGDATGNPVARTVGVLALVTLVGTWTWCGVATTRAVILRREPRSGPAAHADGNSGAQVEAA